MRISSALLEAGFWALTSPPRARRLPRSSTIEMREGLRSGPAGATSCWTACTCGRPSCLAPRILRMIEAPGFGRVEVAIEEGQVRLPQPGHQEDEESEHDQADAAERGDANCAKILNHLDESVHVVPTSPPGTDEVRDEPWPRLELEDPLWA